MARNATTPVKNDLTTAVLLCGDLVSLGAGLDLEELLSSLEVASPGIAVEIVPDFCRNLARLSPIVARLIADRVVLGLCSGEYSQVEFQARVRKAGLDPFGLEVVPLGTLCAMAHPEPQATKKARTLLVAAVARARAFPGSGPEHSKLYFPSLGQKVTRRSLFTVPPIAYRPVPNVAEERCAAEAGCHLCVGACPRDALQRTNGRIFLDKTRCEGCGVCLAACPREAIDFPGWSLAQFEAQLTALLDSAKIRGESFGLLLSCQKAFGTLEELAHQGVSYSHRWLPVTVPCLGMVTPIWVLQALANGAEAVALLSCGVNCPFGQEQNTGGRVDFCCRLLRLPGQADRVRLLSASDTDGLARALQEEPPQAGRGYQSKPGDRLRLGAAEGAFKALRCLADLDGELSNVALEHPHSPFGILEIRSEGCTACLACAEVCPTGALVSERDEDKVTLTYLPSSCTGCGMCADACPERGADILRVRRMTDLDTLSLARVVLHRDRLAICEGCGASIASQALLRRIGASLETGNENLRNVLSRYCPSCRSSFTWGATTSPHDHGAASQA